jgi:hypothetical protein
VHVNGTACINASKECVRETNLHAVSRTTGGGDGCPPRLKVRGGQQFINGALHKERWARKDSHCFKWR